MLRDELWNEISIHEFQEAMILEEIEPFGERAAFIRTGMLCSVIANVNRGKNDRVLKPEDFIPRWDEHVEEVIEPMDGHEFFSFFKRMKIQQDRHNEKMEEAKRKHGLTNKGAKDGRTPRNRASGSKVKGT